MQPDKQDTLVVDFVNEPKDIQQAFQTYYQNTLIDEETDIDGIYDLVDQMHSYSLFNKSDVEEFGVAAYSTENTKNHSILHNIVQSAYDEYGALDIEEQEEFELVLKKYIDKYGYLTQLIPIENKYLLYLNVFGKRLYKAINVIESHNDIHIENKVELINYLVQNNGVMDISLSKENGQVKGDTTGIGNRITIEEKTLSEILELINEIFGGEISEEQTTRFIDNIYGMGLEDNNLETKARVNDKETFVRSFIEDDVYDLFEKGKEINKKMYDETIKNDPLFGLLGDLLAEKFYERFNMK